MKKIFIIIMMINLCVALLAQNEARQLLNYVCPEAKIKTQTKGVDYNTQLQSCVASKESMMLYLGYTSNKTYENPLRYDFNSVILSKDGEIIASHKLKQGLIPSISFSENGRIMSDDHFIYDLQKDKSIATLNPRQFFDDDFPSRISFSPSGDYFFTDNDERLQLLEFWDNHGKKLNLEIPDSLKNKMVSSRWISDKELFVLVYNNSGSTPMKDKLYLVSFPDFKIKWEYNEGRRYHSFHAFQTKLTDNDNDKICFAALNFYDRDGEQIYLFDRISGEVIKMDVPWAYFVKLIPEKRLIFALSNYHTIYLYDYDGNLKSKYEIKLIGVRPKDVYYNETNEQKQIIYVHDKKSEVLNLDNDFNIVSSKKFNGELIKFTDKQNGMEYFHIINYNIPNNRSGDWPTISDYTIGKHKLGAIK